MEELLPWFRLKSVPGIGNHTYRRLIDRFGSPEQVFAASPQELLQVEGVNQKHTAAIRHHKMPDAVRRDIDLVGEKGFRVVPYTDAGYPSLLKEIPDPPPLLYVYGDLGAATNNLAVVGSRNATAYGLSTTKQLCAVLSGFGITIVSGMALGIDTAAHEGALQAKGKTIAVLGSGLGRIYPAGNRDLFHEISRNGAVVSEFPMMTEPEAYNFPIRNRVISGLSLGTVVVEATRRSGSLITARLAAEQNREVFAVPGSIRSFKSMGTHTLIKQGAKLVENAQDILEELSPLIEMPASGDADAGAEPVSAKTALPPMSADERRVFDALGPYPIHIDEVVRQVAMAPGKVLSVLLQLELKEVVQQSPGKHFSVMVETDEG